jgi:hypothetical protein
LIKELVDVRVADKTVEIFLKGQRVASQARAPTGVRLFRRKGPRSHPDGRSCAAHAASLRNSAAIGFFAAIDLDRNYWRGLRGHQDNASGDGRRADAPTRAGPDGLIRIWLDPKFVDRLGQMRGPGESYSEVILRMAKA